MTDEVIRRHLSGDLVIGIYPMLLNETCHFLAVDFDGDQHLNDPAAYRRDRRKDALLQENGYFILRFLTTDLGKNLDHVLDRIQRTMSHLEREFRI